MAIMAIMHKHASFAISFVFCLVIVCFFANVCDAFEGVCNVEWRMVGFASQP